MVFDSLRADCNNKLKLGTVQVCRTTSDGGTGDWGGRSSVTVWCNTRNSEYSVLQYLYYIITELPVCVLHQRTERIFIDHIHNFGQRRILLYMLYCPCMSYFSYIYLQHFQKVLQFSIQYEIDSCYSNFLEIVLPVSYNSKFKCYKLPLEFRSSHFQT
jgi:hypothetical protein